MEAALAELMHHGTWVVTINVLLQQLGLPIPAVPTMMVAGALAGSGRMAGTPAFLGGVAASLAADLLWFWAGRHFGYPVLRLLCRVSLSPDTCVRQTEGIFERWGFFSVVISKFVPGFSTVAPPIAGALRMRVAAFAAASTASAALWVGAAMLAGYLFAPQIDMILAWTSEHVQFALVVVAIALALYVGWKTWQRLRLARDIEAALIDADELAQILRGDLRPCVVDVGSPIAQRARPHIPGAVFLDLDAIARAADWPLDRDIVLYCACPNEESSRRAAQILRRRGFTRVRPLRGGLDGWIARGHPVEHGMTARLTPAGAGRSTAPVS
jgi:membrane protein DedA with SNARE-associated domain/rhodanese-related sulfurtransferase